MNKIGFIGMGNMGKALLKGALKSNSADKFIFSDKYVTDEAAQSIGVEKADDNISCVKAAKYIFLAVKPQYFKEVADEIKDYVTKDKVIVSIMAGLTMDTINESLGGNARVIRVMPNTPALVEAGMSGVCFDASEYIEEEKNTVLGILEACGRVKIVTEAMMSAVTCASGSSPAYVYIFIEALADSVVKYGIPRDAAYEMAAQTVLGAAKMVLETGENPSVLKDRVCSPGGTTIAAVVALEEYGFRNAIFKATDKCYARAEELK
ncbi:MAG: pyrroline-5-carboxylate reductase [Lachnospiraceae bacterium]|nr:pyrroline-5-carboxylate reductase [Lachnospiraceae bacterium]